MSNPVTEQWFCVLGTHPRKPKNSPSVWDLLRDWQLQETRQIAAQYAIDLRAAEAFLRVNPGQAAFLHAVAPENGNSAPTVVLGVRMLDAPLPLRRLVKASLANAEPTWRVELIRLPLPSMSRAGSGIKQLGWGTLDGTWPPTGESELDDYNSLIWQALVEASFTDPRLSVLARLIIVPAELDSFPHYSRWTFATHTQVRSDVKKAG